MRLSVLVLVTWALCAIAGMVLPLEPDRIALAHILQPPGSTALLGHDDLGRDLGARLITGASTSLFVSLWVVSLSLVIGTLVGTLAAYRGGWWDRIAVIMIDIFLAFPGILLAIALAGLLGPGLDNVVIALTAVGWVGFARLARAQVLALMQQEHVLAAEALGTTGWQVVRCHLVPLMAAPLIVEATFGVAAVVIAEAGLSFLGLGIQPPQASWGTMIRDGARYMLVAPHMVMVPGIAIMLVVMAVNRLGDRLRDHLDKRYVPQTGEGM